MARCSGSAALLVFRTSTAIGCAASITGVPRGLAGAVAVRRRIDRLAPALATS